MNATSDLSFPSHANAFDRGLSLEAVRSRAPAVFAASAHERLSAKYTFVPSERVLAGLMSAGFLPVDARQASARRGSPLQARHVVRLRPRFDTVQLKDSIAEVVFLNSHDGTSAYQLRMGLFRVVCTNGLIVSRGAFPAYCGCARGKLREPGRAGRTHGATAALQGRAAGLCRAGARVAVSGPGAERDGTPAASRLPAHRRRRR